MTLRQILIAHLVAAVVVTILVFAAMFFDAASSYRSLGMLALLPMLFGIVYLCSILPVVLLRQWAARKGWNSYWHAVLVGAGSGVILYGGVVGAMSGREIVSEPGLAFSVFASGIGLGAAGGLTFLATERRLHRKDEVT